MLSVLTKKVLREVVPTPEERKVEQRMARFLLQQIKKTKGLHIGVVLAGSLARDTHLRGDRDLDIFVFYPPSLPREKFESEGLKLGHSIFGHHFHEEAFSEHPYVRGVIDGFNVEIVPTYKVDKAHEKISAVDRTPFHAQYMKKGLSPKQCNEVRLLKQFFKGIRVYGADVRFQGVPGYLVETLVLKYENFEKSVKAISKWRDQTVIDIESSFASEKEALLHFKHPFLVVVDPTDSNRNVAAALSYNQFARMVLACRAFLKKPTLEFFFSHREQVLSVSRIKKFFAAEELMGIHFPYPKETLSDVMWGQLNRLTQKLSHALQQHSFSVTRAFFWTDGQSNNFIIFNVENPRLPQIKTRTGPKVVEENHTEQFLAAHPHPISGPRVENGRVVLEVERKIWKFYDALKIETQKMSQTEKDDLKRVLSKADLVSEERLLSIVKKDSDFARELSVFLKGREPFL